MNAMNYENFIRDAFGLASGKRVGRQEDPAAYADTDAYTAGSLAKVKAGAAYAMGIFINNIKGQDMDIYDKANAFVGRVIAAGSCEEVTKNIETFEQTIVKVYFERIDGILEPKK